MDGFGRKVLPSGPPQADILIIGEAPGRMEANYGKPFVGESGQELDNYLERNNINRWNCRVTNVFPFRPPANRDPKPEEIEQYLPDLLAEIERCDPRYIITCGKVPLNVFKPDAKTMEFEHGVPFMFKSITVIPCYHPAAGLHRPKVMTSLLEDFEVVGKVVRGEYVWPTPKKTTPQYKEVSTILEFWNYIDDNMQAQRVVSIDT